MKKFTSAEIIRLMQRVPRKCKWTDDLAKEQGTFMMKCVWNLTLGDLDHYFLKLPES